MGIRCDVVTGYVETEWESESRGSVEKDLWSQCVFFPLLSSGKKKALQKLVAWS